MGDPGASLKEALDLVDWRRKVGELYRLGARAGISAFRAERDRLFATHPQSPLPPGSRSRFQALRYFPFDPAYRVVCRLQAPPPGLPVELEIDTGGPDGVIRYRRAGRLEFELAGMPCHLTVLSLTGYGGGLFLPFLDSTSGAETYGGGRYLFDTIKGTDALCLEYDVGTGRTIIDFNLAYNPSCAYSSRWACPLAPPENRLSVAVRAGELGFDG